MFKSVGFVGIRNIYNHYADGLAPQRKIIQITLTGIDATKSEMLMVYKIQKPAKAGFCISKLAIWKIENHRCDGTEVGLKENTCSRFSQFKEWWINYFLSLQKYYDP